MKKEIRPLTSMRGIAASAVVFSHFSQNQSLPSAALQNVIGRGYLWVDFFFTLSGFVMAESHGLDFCADSVWLPTGISFSAVWPEFIRFI
jgi:peptidoglycan/LPS O-acetylase OafA/YrhL